MAKVTYNFGYDRRLSVDFDSKDLPQDGDRWMSIIEGKLTEYLVHMARHHLQEFLSNRDLQKQFQEMAIRHFLKTGKQPIYTVHKCTVTHDPDEHQKDKEHVANVWTDRPQEIKKWQIGRWTIRVTK